MSSWNPNYLINLPLDEFEGTFAVSFSVAGCYLFELAFVDI